MSIPMLLLICFPIQCVFSVIRVITCARPQGYLYYFLLFKDFLAILAQLFV